MRQNRQREQDYESDEESDNEVDTTYTKGFDHGEIISQTDTAFAQSLTQATSDKEITNANFTEFDISPLIVNWKKVQLLDDEYLALKKGKYSHENTLLRFEKDNKSSIDYLVKEFEMRKKASAYKRTRVASTGSIDPNKLHSYKFNDDIFRKIGITPDGKNHGVTLFVDFSGSMFDMFKPTIDQLITVTHFLRKVSIPFEVYAFTTGGGYNAEEKDLDALIKKTNLNYKNGDMTHYDRIDHVCILNLLSSKMTNTQYRKMADDLLDAAELTLNHQRLINKGSLNRDLVFDKHLYYSHRNWNFSMCGTPLNLLLNGSVDMINKFKAENRIENHTVLFITDGADHDYCYVHNDDDTKETLKVGASIYNRVSYVKDTKSGKIYKTHKISVTPTFVERLKDRTNSTIMNFFIVQNKTHEIENVLRRHGISTYTYSSTDIDPVKKFRAEKSASAYDFGFDEVIMVPDTALTLDNDNLNDLVSSDDSLRKITSAFKKMNKSRLTNRVFLAKIIENVA